MPVKTSLFFPKVRTDIFRGRKAALALILLVLVALVGTSGLACLSNSQTSGDVTREEVSVTIPEGASLREVARDLEEKRIIRSALIFRLYVRYKEMDKNIMKGDYVFLTNSSYQEALEVLRQGPIVVTYKIPIPEGYTVAQVADKVQNSSPISRREFLEVAIPQRHDYPFLEGVSSLEGFLFPKTYEITEETSAEQLVDMMLAQFATETEGLDWRKAEAEGFSTYDIVKIASMIEREAHVPEERRLISGVIHNRLKQGMTLGIDATLTYWLDKWDEPLTVSDLQTDTPYNTRLYPGLPPTPIANPGLESIKAALNPADVDYLYFVVTDEERRTHTFTRTYEEHVKILNQKRKEK
ncbi:endolytic transglycosylase MltG [Candidatus Hakubella thermalkaliphila]|uniref:Endolytic murein transglycosylase n=5 Tax=Candidatus Hakubella thermalkaliphila TaxID=2754717 RepID=A0A6V8PCC1_9ACTN|nr:endolytic transglycosylase MltG [Candidatus Hakubella thermalkaliphila]GFP30369.1 UPF0755 protein [Candidatus Hakubella thermalkaliphila]GFP42648.1 UPF0755 protein [Candidatus Hakubella thermalkaliphila]